MVYSDTDIGVWRPFTTRIVTDGRTDKVIAVTLRLHFAARVNKQNRKTISITHSVHVRTVLESGTVLEYTECEIHAFSTRNTGVRTRCERLIMEMKWKCNSSTSWISGNKPQTIIQLGGTAAISHALFSTISSFPTLFQAYLSDLN